MLLNKII